jgi:hypothetical protein
MEKNYKKSISKSNAFILFLVISVLLLFTVIITSCKSSKKTPTAPSESQLTIKGNFTGGSNARGFSASDFLAFLFGGERLYALDPLQVAKVAIFEGYNGYRIVDVVNGGFSIDAQAGKPTGMIFIGATGNFLGYLSLGSGMESIPLNMAADGVNTIDLQTLSSTLGIVDPGHNPIGSEIPMTSDDIIAYAFGSGAYASVIKSPDIDGDGIVDITTGYFFRYYFSYGVMAGNFGANLTPALLNPITINNYRLGIKINDPGKNFPASIMINGPAGSGLEGVQNDSCCRFPSPDGSMCGYYSPYISIPPIPPAGAYVVTYGSKTLTFNVPDQTNVIKYMAIPVPSVVLNNNGTINKITWAYKLSDGSASVDPKALVDTIGIQISALTITGATGIGVQSYSVYDLPGSTTENTPSNQSITWSMVTNVTMDYTDVFGDNIGVMWSKP